MVSNEQRTASANTTYAASLRCSWQPGSDQGRVRRLGHAHIAHTIQTAGYVAHHLKIAGRSDTLFSDDALALIHQVSRGLPRAINNLAVQSLVAAFADSKAIVDESSARAAVTEVTTD